jgi:hypothetical protein
MDMLALTDAAFARLVRGAREGPRRARGRWLRDIAAKLDPPRIRQDLRDGERESAKRMVRSEAARRRRADDTCRWRERLHRGATVYPVEVDGTTFDLMERFGGLEDSKTADKQAVATALGKLLRRALEALLREEGASRR